MRWIVLSLLLLAGCADGPKQGSHGIAVLEVDEGVRGYGSWQADLQEGDHCGGTTYNGTALDVQRSTPLPGALYVRRFHAEDFPNGLPRYGGGDPIDAYARGVDGAVDLTFAFDRTPMAHVAWQDGNFVVNGSALPPGASWTASHVTHQRDGFIVESVRLRVRDDVAVRTHEPPGCD